MGVKSVLKAQIENIRPEKSKIKEINELLGTIRKRLEAKLKIKRVDADVFLGGSFPKNTIIKKKLYDVDIFVRFNPKYEKISDILGKALEELSREYDLNLERVHGSRDYFRIKMSDSIVFEIIPVVRIGKPEEAENVTDLSYFHVSYVRRKSKRLEDQIRLAKSFCIASGVYGAESYIGGFSGYALECLIIYYKSFEKMLKQLSKVKERLVIDIEKKYRKKDDVLFQLNESKLHSPIVLIDPTYKQRNALAALSHETFAKFQNKARQFLKKPSIGFFEVKEFDSNSFRQRAKNNVEFLHLILKTNRQRGDIAGTKLKKFHYFIEKMLEKHFDFVGHHFEYSGEDEADVFLLVKSRKDIVRAGPPIKMKKFTENFKKMHKNAFIKAGRVYAKIDSPKNCRKFLENYLKENEKQVHDMGVVSFRFGA